MNFSPFSETNQRIKTNNNMKRRILNIIAVLFLMVGTATAQSLSVADLEVKPNRYALIEVNISAAAEMTALQFNLSLPSGILLGDNIVNPMFCGDAVKGHTVNVLPLESGDYLVVLYNMNKTTFGDGVLMNFSVVAGENSGTTIGSLYNVRMSTADAVSHKCEDVSFKVTVNAPVTGISLDKETISITEGETETLTATITPSNATDKTVTWTTSDSAIATVDGGVVTAVKAGTATITATAGAYSANCVVTVEVATSIENINSENSVVKAIYDLQGRKVANPSKGIYIVNGKRVLIK